MISIFVVDHAAGYISSLRKALSEADATNYKVCFAADYLDILEGFRGGNYDVCLIDSAGSNGCKLFAQARSLGFDAPIILLTSNDAGEAVTAIRRGVADCLIRDDLTAASIERSICSVVEQARTSKQQGERERRYLALMDNAGEIIYTHDLEGNVTSMNPAGEQAIGYSQEEWSDLAMWQLVHPGYRDIASEMVRQTLDAQRQTFRAIALVTKQGRRLSVEVGSHLIYRQGKAVEIQWVARDLTGPKQSAATLIRNSQLYGVSQAGARSA